jgi:hypothetical protein
MKRTLASRIGVIAASCICLCALLLVEVPVAEAAKTGEFGIVKFAVQTTHAREVRVGRDRYFVNEPYTFTQAGGHPDGLTSRIEFSTTVVEEHHVRLVLPRRDVRDIMVDVPPGLLGNPQAVPRCSLTVVLYGRERCPAASQVGVVVLHLLGSKELVGPIVNLVPEAGQSAEFGLENESKFTYLLTGHVVRTAAGYGLTVVSNEIPMTELYAAELTFWGVPADPVHDAQRGMFCSRVDVAPYPACQGGDLPANVAQVPFLTMPADCAAGPEDTTVRADSWEEQGRYIEKTAEEPLPTTVGGAAHSGFTGCDRLQFGPSVEVQPDTFLADEPVGLGVNLRIPQIETAQAPATPQLRDSVLTFPEGMSVSPSVVDGIRACDESGPSGIDFTGPESEEIRLNGEPQLAPGHCPDSSIIGTAEAETPLLASPVKGHVYLARPGCGGAGQAACTDQDVLDGNLYRLYLELGGTGALANTGVNLKIRLKTDANPVTGQLTIVSEETAQLPFSELRVRLNGGPRAPVDNPPVCGPAITTAGFMPWSAPGITPEGLSVAGTREASSSSSYEVTGCSDPPGLTPRFMAGMVSPQAGRFSAFTLNLSRQDREQYIKGVQLRIPPGLLGMLAGVPLCGEPEADRGDCPAASKVGTTRVASGSGSHPFEIEGSVYLTGPYCGPPGSPAGESGCAPFGLSIATHAAAGPFDLGLVVVRARVSVDPHTSSLTVTTDETGPHAIPQIVFGVPLRLQRITASIDRHGFMFNPTNCAEQTVAARVSGVQGGLAQVSGPFAAVGCRSLAFKPNFAVSTSGRTSRTVGASLDARLTFPSDAFGNDANVARVKVSLPKQLPSRLTTLQKACPVATFETDPAACPRASIVGIARAYTPLLPILTKPLVCTGSRRSRSRCPMEPPISVIGPAYFVSYGSEAFPQLIVVLQGDGVRVDLAGSTFISKAGITSSTFKTVPDVPVGSFELYLPQGRNSALAANGNLCKQRGKLKMPTEFVAQNGATIKRNTQIVVMGCAARRARKAR